MIIAAAYVRYKETDSTAAFNGCDSFLLCELSLSDFFDAGFKNAKKSFLEVDKSIRDADRVNLLAANKVDVIIAGYISDDALKAMDKTGIASISGCLRDPYEAIEIFLNGGNPGSSCGGSCGSCESGCESGS